MKPLRSFRDVVCGTRKWAWGAIVCDPATVSKQPRGETQTQTQTQTQTASHPRTTIVGLPERMDISQVAFFSWPSNSIIGSTIEAFEGASGGGDYEYGSSAVCLLSRSASVSVKLSSLLSLTRSRSRPCSLPLSLASALSLALALALAPSPLSLFRPPRRCS